MTKTPAKKNAGLHHRLLLITTDVYSLFSDIRKKNDNLEQSLMTTRAILLFAQRHEREKNVFAALNLSLPCSVRDERKPKFYSLKHKMNRDQTKNVCKVNRVNFFFTLKIGCLAAANCLRYIEMNYVI